MKSHEILSDDELTMLLSTESDKESKPKQPFTEISSYLPRSKKSRKKRSLWQKPSK
jgi:hypothetical protein